VFSRFRDAEIDSAASGTIEQFGAPEAAVYVGFNGVPPAVMMELHELLASSACDQVQIGVRITLIRTGSGPFVIVVPAGGHN
jgi:hypothetical protein